MGGVLESQNSKCQDWPKFQFFGGCSGKSKWKCQDLPKFQFGGGSALERQNPKYQDLPKFQFSEGGCSGTKFQFGGKLSNFFKISGSLGCLCITDSLSHTTYVETNGHQEVGRYYTGNESEEPLVLR